MSRTLTIREWYQLTLEGNAPPVRITLNGYSMNPLIRGYRDYVTVAGLEGELRPGDIVLFFDAENGRYVMHRIWELKDGMALTWGDNCDQPDGWIRLRAIRGKIVLIERGKRKIRPDPARGRRWAAFWHKAGKVWRFGERCKNGVIRRIKKKKV